MDENIGNTCHLTVIWNSGGFLLLMSLRHTHSCAQLHTRNPSLLSILTHAYYTDTVTKCIPLKSVLNWSILHRPQTCTDAFILITPIMTKPLSSFLKFCPPLSVALLLLVHLSLDLSLPFLPQSLSILSLSSVLSPLLGIGGSISFKAHVKGTVCRFQRPLCPAFLPLNLVSPKHFPIAWPSRPLFSQLPLSSHLSLPLARPTVLNTFYWRWYAWSRETFL